MPIKLKLAIGAILRRDAASASVWLVSGEPCDSDKNAVESAMAKSTESDDYTLLKNIFSLLLAEKITANDARVDGNAALRWAAERGKVGVMRFLRDHFNLTAADARQGVDCDDPSCSERGECECEFGYDETALVLAANSGRAAAMRFLRVGFGLTAADAQKGACAALLFAARGGHFDALRELREGFGLTADDVRQRNNCALRCVVQYDDICAKRELCEGFKLTADDALDECDEYHDCSESCPSALSIAALKKDVQYLCSWFGFTESDARAGAQEDAARYGFTEDEA